MQLRCATRTLDLSSPVVMGILNVTPDSFSDGGRYVYKQAALGHARQMISEGAAIIDVGGESTRPGANPVTEQEELNRVIPVIEGIRAQHDVFVSVDTSTPAVMKAALAAGADIINDVRALTRHGALQVAAETGTGVCLMHMLGEPTTMQHAPSYQQVVDDVLIYLRQRVSECERAGIKRESLMIDPGIGFGKSVSDNLALLAQTRRFVAEQLPVLIGVSRKSVIGAVLNRPVNKRLAGGLALATAGVLAGARIIRTHDVAATVDTVRMAQALQQSGFMV